MVILRVRWYLTLSLIYALQLGSGFAYTYFPRYLASLGWSAAVIGTLWSVSALARSFIMPGWSLASDRPLSNGRHRGISLVKIQFLLVIPVLALPFVTDPILLGGLLIWSSVTIGCSLPILDVVTMKSVGPGSFGRVRAAGSLGFGLVAVIFAVGGLRSSHESLAQWSPWLVAGGTALGILTAWSLPPLEASPTEPATRGNRNDLRKMLTNPWILVLMPLWCLHWASQGPYNIFLVFLAETRSFPGWVPGAAVAAGISAEVLFLAVGQRFVDRVGPVRSFAVIVFVTGLRWLATAWTPSPMLVIALQLLHGLSFGGFMLSMMAVLNREIPPSIRTSAQALLYVVVFGIGTAIGQGGSGMIIEHSGSIRAFEVAGWLEFAILIPTFAIVLFYRRHGRHLTSAM